MICPVCEHQQDFGVECEVCGKDLGGLGELGPPPVREERVEGLEVTVPDRLGDVPVEKLGELEITHFSPVNVAPDQTPDVEHTGLPQVGEVPIERVADLSEDRVPDDGQRTPYVEGPITCRYCRNVQATGTLCDRCGMKLPIVAAPVMAVLGTMEGELEVMVRCRACGARTKAGGRCSDCGNEVPYPEA